VPGSLPWTAGIISPRVLNLRAVCLTRFVEAVGPGSPGPQETTSWAAQKPRLAQLQWKLACFPKEFN